MSRESSREKAHTCCQLSPGRAAEGGTSYHLEKLAGMFTMAHSGCPALKPTSSQ